VPDPNDRRSRLIRATAAGHARLATAQSAISAAEAELLGVLDAEQQKSLRAMLRELAAHNFGAEKTVNPCSMAERVREGTV
jgi:DNA-binding MarR family transcriptional regulator